MESREEHIKGGKDELGGSSVVAEEKVRKTEESPRMWPPVTKR